MTKRFFVLFGLLICAGAAAAEPLVEGDVEAGKQKSATCAACHGPQGNMQSDQFPKLAGQGGPYLVQQLKLFKSGERDNPIMMGQAAGLSEQDMKDLAAYYASQQTRIGAADVSVAPAGAKIYHGGKPPANVPSCAGCHGPAGLGNAAAAFPRLSGQSASYIASQLKAYRDGARAGYRSAAIMNGVAERLSDADIRALASYVSGLAPANGQANGTEYGALMQNAGVPGEPAAAGGESQQAPSDAQQTDSQPSGAAANTGAEAQASAAADEGAQPQNGADEDMGEPQGSAAEAPQANGAASAGQAAGTHTQAEASAQADTEAAGQNFSQASGEAAAPGAQEGAGEDAPAQAGTQ